MNDTEDYKKRTVLPKYRDQTGNICASTIGEPAYHTAICHPCVGHNEWHIVEYRHHLENTHETLRLTPDLT